MSASAASRIAERSLALGLDPVVAFSPAWLDEASPEGRALARAGRGDLGILFASGRSLWPHFSAALSADLELLRDPNPLDRFVERSVAASLGELASRSRVVFAHAVPPEGAFPIQRLAGAIGFAALAPSHLSVHPELGPWLALRAVAVISGETFAAPRPALESPCRGCPAPCVAALEDAVRVSSGEVGRDAVIRHADAWIGVRDACPVGREARYGPAQIDFHYRGRLP